VTPGDAFKEDRKKNERRDRGCKFTFNNKKQKTNTKKKFKKNSKKINSHSNRRYDLISQA
jgi:hypothetical protein